MAHSADQILIAINQPIVCAVSLCHSCQADNAVPDKNRPLQKNQFFENWCCESFCTAMYSCVDAALTVRNALFNCCCSPEGGQAPERFKH